MVEAILDLWSLTSFIQLISQSYHSSSKIYREIKYVFFIMYVMCVCVCSPFTSIFTNIMLADSIRKWQPTPVFLPGKFNGQRSLVGYSCKESGTTEQMCAHTHTHTYCTLTHTCTHMHAHTHMHMLVKTTICFLLDYYLNH